MATRKKTITFAGGNTLSNEGDFDQVWTFNATGAVWTDETTDASTSGGADVPLFTAVGSELYLGMTSQQFTGFFIDMTTNAAGGTRVLEYWNGSAWASLTATFIAGAVLLSADTSVRFDPPSDWATTSVNGSANRFWVRFRTTVLHTTAGTLQQISAAAFARVFSAKTINLPAVTGRTITNAFVRVWYYQPAAGTQIDIFRILSRVDAASFTDDYYRIVAQTLTGEASTDEVMVDMTSKLVSGFTGTSHTLDLDAAILVRGNNATANNTRQMFSAELVITYTYDDAQAVQMNTVKIPIESITGNLTATLASIGTNQVPQLTGVGGLLEEASITIRQMYFVFDGNMRSAGTADFTLGVRLDAEAEATPWGITDNENQTDCRQRVIWERNDMDPATSHNLDARVSNVAGAVWSQFGGYLVVTYEYNESTTTRYTISVQSNIQEELGFVKGATASLEDLVMRKFFIPESNVTLKQSGVQVRYQATADMGNLLFKCGAQTYRTYAVTQGLGADDYTLFHRFDSGAAAGSGITFARGEITLESRYYADTTVENASTLTSIMMLNYACDKTSGRKTSCVTELVIPEQSASATRRTASYGLSIPESTYWLNALFSRLKTTSGNGPGGLVLKANKGTNLGWSDIAAYMISREVELGHNWQFGRLRPAFKRYVSDPDTERVDVETSRTWAFESANATIWSGLSVSAWWTDFVWTVAGTVSNYSGSGVGIPVNIFRADNDELIGQVTTTSGGAFTFDWFDNTVSVYAVAYEGSTRKGVSLEQVAGNTFDIDLNPSSGGASVVWGFIA